MYFLFQTSQTPWNWNLLVTNLKEPKYTLEEARIHDASYSAPIFVTFRLINKENGEIKTQEVFFGDFPMMTEMGT